MFASSGSIAVVWTISTTEAGGGWKFSTSAARRGGFGGAAIVEFEEELLKTYYEGIRRFLSEAPLLWVAGAAGATGFSADNEAEYWGSTNSLCGTACSSFRWFQIPGKSGFFGMRPRTARDMLEREHETLLPGSRLRCFILFSTFGWRVNCFTWLWICSSTSFSQVRGPRRSA